MVEAQTATAESLFRFTELFLSAEVREMIRLHGMEECGAGEYYLQRVRARNGDMFPRHERDLYFSMAALAGDHKLRVVHAGPGLGTFSILLSLSGISVLGIEMGRARAWGARQLRAAYVQAFPENESRYEFREGEYPKALRPEDLKPDFKNVLLFTNVGGEWPEGLEQKIIDTFKLFDFVYFCPSMFGSRGRSKEGCEELRTMITTAVPGELQRISDTIIFHDCFYMHKVSN